MNFEPPHERSSDGPEPEILEFEPARVMTPRAYASDAVS